MPACVRLCSNPFSTFFRHSSDLSFLCLQTLIFLNLIISNWNSRIQFAIKSRIIRIKSNIFGRITRVGAQGDQRKKWQVPFSLVHCQMYTLSRESQFAPPWVDRDNGKLILPHRKKVLPLYGNRWFLFTYYRQHFTHSLSSRGFCAISLGRSLAFVVKIPFYFRSIWLTSAIFMHFPAVYLHLSSLEQILLP